MSFVDYRPIGDIGGEKTFTVTLSFRGVAFDEADAIAAARAGMLTEVGAEAVEE